MSDPNIRRVYRCHRFAGIVLLAGLLFLPACSTFVSSAAGKFADNLSTTILNHNDPETVKDACPAYLLMIEGLSKDAPNNESLLRTAATLHTAYADVYVKDAERAKKLSDKGLDYAFRAMCVRQETTCSLKTENSEKVEKIIGATTEKDVPALYVLGTSWAGRIRAYKQDWNAVADIPKVETIMRQVAKLKETYRDGAAHLYLGVLATLLPPALGGKPDQAKTHFERAIVLSGGKNLMVKVMYARQYARLIFDRELHDRLLKEVIEADPNVPGYTLTNTLARKEAKELLESADGYF